MIEINSFITRTAVIIILDVAGGSAISSVVKQQKELILKYNIYNIENQMPSQNPFENYDIWIGFSRYL